MTMVRRERDVLLFPSTRLNRCTFSKILSLMTFFRGSSLVIVLTLLASPTFASKEELEAVSLIQRAKQLSDIRAEGAPPFRLKLDFKVVRDDGSLVDGSYTETWVSKTQWRKETEMGDFREIQIAAGSRLWLLDSTPVPSQQIVDIANISDVSRLRPEAWKSRKDRHVNGVEVRCLENSIHKATWAVCFDQVSGTLYEEIRPSHALTAGDERVCWHSDYQKFGGYTVARSYECQERHHTKLQARVVELTTDAAQNPALFVPPEGARESVNCLGTTKPPTVIHHVDPIVPKTFSGTHGVIISTVVGIDGRPRDLTVISAPNRDYDEAALAALQQWRYMPATCDLEPIETRIEVDVEFHLFFN